MWKQTAIAKRYYAIWNSDKLELHLLHVNEIRMLEYHIQQELNIAIV